MQKRGWSGVSKGVTTIFADIGIADVNINLAAMKVIKEAILMQI